MSDDPFAMLADAIAARDAEWRQRAACRGLPTAWFYPEQGESYSNARQAKEVCRQCAVRDECWAAGRTEAFGIWAGVSIKNRRRPEPPTCTVAAPGTDAGYKHHIRRREPACDECKAAHREAVRDTRPQREDDPGVMNHPEMIGPARRWALANEGAA